MSAGEQVSNVTLIASLVSATAAITTAFITSYLGRRAELKKLILSTKHSVYLNLMEFVFDRSSSIKKLSDVGWVLPSADGEDQASSSSGDSENQELKRLEISSNLYQSSAMRKPIRRWIDADINLTLAVHNYNTMTLKLHKYMQGQKTQLSVINDSYHHYNLAADNLLYKARIELGIEPNWVVRLAAKSYAYLVAGLKRLAKARLFQ